MRTIKITCFWIAKDVTNFWNKFLTKIKTRKKIIKKNKRNSRKKLLVII
jgi:hypothetical protein